MRDYQANVWRDDRWWMITVPELAHYTTADGSVSVGDTTQARRLVEVPRQARDFICAVTDSAPSEVGITITITVDGVDVTGRAEQIAKDRELAAHHSAAAQAEAKRLARDLAAAGVPVRDVGEVLGVSFQRAQQLISA